MPEAVAFAFMPPSIPGLGNAGGFSFWLQDRSGGSIEFLDAELQKFLAAARKRPELAGVDLARSRADVPQIFADVDRDKALSRAWRSATSTRRCRRFSAGSYVNQFNRFGRQWRVFLQAEGEDRTSAEPGRPVLRAQRRRHDGAALGAAVD